MKAPFKATVGHVVVIKDDLPRGCWKLGKIKELKHSSDGQVRFAIVKLSSGHEVKRALNLLYPLEVSMDITTESEQQCTKSDTEHRSQPRLKRKAAIQARENLRSIVHRKDKT